MSKKKQKSTLVNTKTSHSHSNIVPYDISDRKSESEDIQFQIMPSEPTYTPLLTNSNCVNLNIGDHDSQKVMGRNQFLKIDDKVNSF